jgi:crossover junction endodeoxyribonuclease RusA
MFIAMMPWPVSLNNAYRNVPRRGRVRSAAYRRWATEADRWLQHQLANGLRLPATPLAGELRLVITAAPPDKRRRDPSNHVKVLEDKLASWKIMEDDSQVHDLRIHWDRADPPTVTPGSVMVVLEVLADAA